MPNCYARNLDNNIYPKKAVADARMAYRDYCDFAIEATASHIANLTVTVKLKYEDNSRDVILGFWNYLLDRACQINAER